MILAHVRAVLRAHSLRVWLLWALCFLVLLAVPFAFADPAGLLLVLDPELAALVATASVALVCSYLPGFRMRMPRSSGSRSRAPHSSQSTANVELNGAEQDGQRRSIVPPHCGHSSGTSASNSSNHRRAAPQPRQNATQSPSTFRRSSRSQSAALPTGQTVARGQGPEAGGTNDPSR